MYKRPYTLEKIKKYYPSQATTLLKDPVHRWRAEIGIELIHKEPTLKEQKRIWKNWQLMSKEQKGISDQKSLELFGINNEKHHYKIMAENY
ncbi:MAG: hypothetical protein M1142_05320 [Patescibacteria group bacterium]|nr:hypothetical protein [Patescibacteria group bacterium]